ncbi:MAG TPA: hypothetical protein VK996_19215 [Ramlibacter sp.]|nr:hypothetical protein [Ramlibacter sp.]
MDTKSMMQVATILLALTAAGGLVMAGIRFAGADRPPSWIAMAHGLLGGAALTLLIYAGLAGGIPKMAWAGVCVLVLAALGGVYLNLAYHDKHSPLPKQIIVVHAIIAVVGFVLVFLSQ